MCKYIYAFKYIYNYIIDMNSFMNENTATKPMKFISYDEKNERWRLRHDEKKIDKKSKDLSKLTSLCKELIEEDVECEVFNIDDLHQEYIKYKGIKIETYIKDDDLYFDLRKTIGLLEYSYKTSQEKYNKYTVNKIFCAWEPNEYGGFLLKEYIDEQTMYDIILNSNAPIAKTFKKDVSKLLVQLRKNHGLVISDEGLKLVEKKNIPVIKKYDMNDSDLEEWYDEVRDNLHKKYDGSIETQIQYAYKNINISRFINKNVLYMVALSMKDPENKERQFIKIGYSSDIVTRLGTLKDEYGCEIYLLKLEYISSERDEKALHDMIKKSCPGLKYEFCIDKSKKVEVYIYSDLINQHFDQFVANHNNNAVVSKNNTLISQNILDALSDNDPVSKYNLIDKITNYNYKMSDAYLQELNLEQHKIQYKMSNTYAKEIELEQQKLNHEMELQIMKEKTKQMELQNQMLKSPPKILSIENHMKYTEKDITFSKSKPKPKSKPAFK